MPNVGSQLDRAIAAYLLSQDAGTAADVFPTWALSTKIYPYTVVKAHQFTHDPMNTGNEIWQVALQFRQSAANDAKEPNPYYKRVELDARIDAAMDALLLTSDVNTQHPGFQNNGQTFDYVAQQITAFGRALALPQDVSAQAQQIAKNNADMANFTCLHWYYRGGARGDPEEEGCAWFEERNFEAVATPSVIN